MQPLLRLIKQIDCASQITALDQITESPPLQKTNSKAQFASMASKFTQNLRLQLLKKYNVYPYSDVLKKTKVEFGEIKCPICA
jgi:hypothetical protein